MMIGQSIQRAAAVTVVAMAMVACTLPARAIMITGVSETPTSLSFQFDGEFGAPDAALTGLPPLTHWSILSFLSGGAAPLTLSSTAKGILRPDYTLFFTVQHGTDGTPTTVRVGDAFSLPGIAPSGPTLTDTESAAHDGGLDIYTLSITLHEIDMLTPGAKGAVGTSFSGSFSAVHTAAVPDSGSTGLLGGLAFLLLAGGRRLLRTANC